MVFVPSFIFKFHFCKLKLKCIRKKFKDFKHIIFLVIIFKLNNLILINIFINVIFTKKIIFNFNKSYINNKYHHQLNVLTLKIKTLEKHKINLN